MRTPALLEAAEALGAVLVVLGLVFWSLPVALVAAGAFLIVASAAPGSERSGPASLGDRAVPRAKPR